MNKYLSYGLIVIGVIIVFIVSIALSYNHFKPEEKNEVEESNVVTNETIVIDDPVEVDPEDGGIEENTVEVDKVENTILNQNNVYESSSDVGSTDRKQDAINLVKSKWGQDDTVTYRCDNINSRGEYVIAVVSKEKAQVLSYFRVNLETKTVEVDY